MKIIIFDQKQHHPEHWQSIDDFHDKLKVLENIAVHSLFTLESTDRISSNMTWLQCIL